MTFPGHLQVVAILVLCAGLTACGQQRSATNAVLSSDAPTGPVINNNRESAPTSYEKSSIWDVFGPQAGDRTVAVNRYIWAATFDVLSFLPVESVDPFTGVIVTGYGTPPGGGRAYRATVHIKDPALEARSLNVALQTSAGPVSAATTRAVEDAILSRARQLRIDDNNL
jgi:hypothetical protein